MVHWVSCGTEQKTGLKQFKGQFQVSKGHLEVKVQVFFEDSKLKSDECNRLSIPKNLENDIWHAPKGDFGKKFCIEVSIGHLGSFGGHFVT